MRPKSLFSLFKPVTTLPGVGPRMARLLERLLGAGRIVDLLWHRPNGVIDRRFRPSIAEAPSGTVVTLVGRVEGHQPGTGPRRPYKILLHDGTARLEVVYFHGRSDWLQTLFPENADIAVSGKIDRYHDRPQMVHPDHVVPATALDSIALVEPVYPLTGGLHPKPLRKAIVAALEDLPDLPEWQDPALLAREGWPGWSRAMRDLHKVIESEGPEWKEGGPKEGGPKEGRPKEAGPKDEGPTVFAPKERETFRPEDDSAAGDAPDDPVDLEDRPERQRLAYDELLATQLALALIRRHMKHQSGRALAGTGSLRAELVAALPYALTGAQERALAEILADIAAPTRMLRLLQGDVGSGKTVIALLAMVTAVEAGTQAALMAPTEILAQQHLETIGPLMTRAGVHVDRLTGRDTGAGRRRILEGLADGRTQMVIGTHALFSDDVQFRDLGLAVIDEQHRFGVHQRLSLGGKGREVDILVMTATPIPRTLMQTVYGDLDVSRLDEKPPGRRPVVTRAVPQTRLEEVVNAVERKLAAGEKLFWVVPLIEETETLDLTTAEERHRHLSDRFGDRVGLVHGQLKAAEKDAVMTAFAGGTIDLLVATTVIEVGVNVPQATVMVIEHAERFGLAQLHQLRGRVGRSSLESACLLLYRPPLGDTARRRLKALCDSEDGFFLAEEDLRLRGAGEVLGIRQSGLPKFRVADPAVDQALMDMAQQEVALLMNRDPELEGPRGEALRILLYLFERDAAVKYVRAG